MNNKKIPLLSAICASVLVFALFLSFVITAHEFSSGSSGISLPEDNHDSSSDLSSKGYLLPNKNIFNPSEIVINKTNLKSVIRNLRAPNEYSFRLENTYYWQDNQGTISSNCFVKNQYTKIERLDTSSNVLEHVMIDGKNFYSWKPSDVNYYKGALASLNTDQILGLPPYNQIITTQNEDILSVDVVYSQNNAPNIIVDMQNGIYVDRYTICINTGIIIGFQKFIQDRCVQSIGIKNISHTEISDSKFTLPNS